MTMKCFSKSLAASMLPALTAAVLFLSAASVSALAQEKENASVSTEYLTEDELPDAFVYLPAPPKPDDPLFAGDLAYYEWGKTIRPTERGQRAHDDAASSLDYLTEILQEAVGTRISNEATPNLYRLLSKSMRTANSANKKAKDYYKRVRPYVEFSQPTGVPEEEMGSRRSASYPSGHTTRGWTVALILSELLPDRSQEILKVGYEYGVSRVIVGYHYQSDVQSARTAASAAVAVMHSNKEFQKDMKKAKKELSRLGLR